MTYVEKNFFEFPIRMYDVYSAMNADIIEDEQLKVTGRICPVQADWFTVIKVCKPKDIIGWVESGERGQDIEELKGNGIPPLTIVTIREGLATASYECNWRRPKFEQKLNEKMQLI